MLRALLVVLAVALSSCSTAPSCYVGVAIIPPGPFVHCGFESSPKPTEEKDDIDV